MIRTIGFPGQYHQGPGALNQVGRFIEHCEFVRPVIICDEFVAEHIVPGIMHLPKNLQVFKFPGECTSQVTDQLALQAKAVKADVVIALGGGKSIDTAKGVSKRQQIPVIICPTIASTDAPTSRLIVMYDEHHRVTGVEYLAVNPLAVFVDTQIIANAPAKLFAAGIGDAISKFFESQQCVRSGGLNSFGTPPLSSALLMAEHCYQLLIGQAEQAYRDVEQHCVTEVVERVTEATVLLSGIGFESGGLSLAHSLIRGLTSVPAMQHALHGEMIAFGTMVQLFASGYSLEQIEPVSKLLKSVSLPLTLQQLGMPSSQDKQVLTQIAEATLAHSYSKNFTPKLTSHLLVKAIENADQYGRRYLQ